MTYAPCTIRSYITYRHTHRLFTITDKSNDKIVDGTTMVNFFVPWGENTNFRDWIDTQLMKCVFHFSTLISCAIVAEMDANKQGIQISPKRQYHLHRYHQLEYFISLCYQFRCSLRVFTVHTKELISQHHRNEPFRRRQVVCRWTKKKKKNLTNSSSMAVKFVHWILNSMMCRGAYAHALIVIESYPTTHTRVDVCIFVYA